MAKFTEYMAAVGLTLITTYPFYEIVRSMTDITGDDLIPCTDEACIFMRYWSGGGVPGTAPDVVQVQNGAARPVVLHRNDTGLFYTSAMAVPWAQQIPRADNFALGYFFGGFFYHWQEKQEAYYGLRWCFWGVCVDSEWYLSFLYWHRGHAQEHVDRIAAAWANATNADHGTNKAVAELQEALQAAQFQNPVVGSAYIIAKGYFNALICPLLSLTGESFASGTERLHSAKCETHTAQDTMVTCDSKKVREKVSIPLASSTAPRVYLSCIVGWALFKILHDILLLHGAHGEEVTLGLGFASILLQGLAVGAGMLTAIGASQVFAAPADGSTSIEYDAKQDTCQCYYKLDDFKALLALTTPCILMLAYINKVKRFAQSTISGDFLYYISYDVPYEIARQNAEGDGSLLVPNVKGSQLAQGSEKQFPQRKVLWFARLGPIQLLFNGWYALVVKVPIMIAASNIVPKFFMVLTRMANQRAWEGPISQAAIRLFIMMPSLAYVGGPLYHLYQNHAGMTGLLHWVIKVSTVTISVILGVLLLLPPPQLFSPYAQDISTSQLQIHFEIWAVGGCFLGLVFVAYLQSTSDWRAVLDHADELEEKNMGPRDLLLESAA